MYSQNYGKQVAEKIKTQNPPTLCYICGQVVHIGEGVWEVQVNKFVVKHEDHKEEDAE